MSTQTINISLPEDLVKKIDKAANAEFASRSDYIRQALVSKLKADRTQQDDWDLLEALSVEIAESASRRGYKTAADSVRAVKEVRRDSLSKATNKQYPLWFYQHNQCKKQSGCQSLLAQDSNHCKRRQKEQIAVYIAKAQTIDQPGHIDQQQRKED